MAPAREPKLLKVDGGSPTRLVTLDDLVLGDAVQEAFAFGRAERAAFASVADDRAPIHEDEDFAKARGFSGTIIQGLCVSSRFSRLIGMYLPGERALLQTINLKFHHPTYENQPLLFQVQIERVLKPLQVVRLLLTATVDGVTHVSGEAQCLIR